MGEPADHRWVTWALVLLRAGCWTASEAQERAADLVYRALAPHFTRLCRTAFRLTEDEAEEVVDRKLTGFILTDVHRVGPTEDDVRRWLTTVCRNEALKVRERRNRRASREINVDQMPDMSAADTEKASAEASPPRELPPTIGVDDAGFDWSILELLPDRIDPRQFVAALADLPEPDQVVFRFVLKRIGEDRHPADLIAERFGLTMNAARVRWARLKKRFITAYMGGSCDAAN